MLEAQRGAFFADSCRNSTFAATGCGARCWDDRKTPTRLQRARRRPAESGSDSPGLSKWCWRWRRCGRRSAGGALDARRKQAVLAARLRGDSDYVEYQPVGVIGIAAPASLPLRTAGILAGALAAGNR